DSSRRGPPHELHVLAARARLASASPVAVVAGASRSPVEGLLAAGDRARWRHQLADPDSAVLYSAAALCLLRQALRPAGAGWLAAGLRGAQRVTRQAVLT